MDADDYASMAIQTGIDHTAAGADRHLRQWRLLIVGDGCGLTAGTAERLANILELFPDITHLDVETRNGPCQASRTFPSCRTDEVDRTIASIFRDDHDVTAITFPGSGTRTGHTAIPDDPYWSSTGKASVDILAARARGEITSEEALERMKRLHQVNTA